MPDGLKLQQHFKLKAPIFCRKSGVERFFSSSQSNNVKRFWQQQLARKQASSLVIGEQGLGKTSSWHQYQAQINYEIFEPVFFSSPHKNTQKLFLDICSQLSIKTTEHKQDLRSSIEKHVIKQQKTLVLVLDQAQACSMTMYAYLFKWLQVAKYKNYGLQLLFIVDKNSIFEKKYKTLQRWIDSTFEYEALRYQDSLNYLIHAEKQSANNKLFHAEARAELARQSEGNIARINTLAQNALQRAFHEKAAQVFLKHVVAEVASNEKQSSLIQDNSKRLKKTHQLLFIAIILFIFMVGGYFFFASTSITTRLAHSDKLLGLERKLSTTEEASSNDAVKKSIDATLPELMVSHKLSQQMAFSALNQYLGLESTVGIEKQQLCQLLLSKHYQCVDFQINLDEALRLNLPLVIKLKTAGSIAYAALLALDHQQALLSIEGELIRLSVDALERYYFGEATILWPSGVWLMPNKLQPGDADKNMPKIRALLIQWADQNHGQKQHVYKSLDSTIYTQDDARLLQVFQQHTNLPVTSIIQPYMLILLQQMIEPASVLLNQPGVFED